MKEKTTRKVWIIKEKNVAKVVAEKNRRRMQVKGYKVQKITESSVVNGIIEASLK